MEFLVEHYLPGATRCELRDASSRLAAVAVGLTDGGAPVRYLGSTLVPAEESCFSRFDSGSEATVRRVFEAAQVTYARILVAERVDPEKGKWQCQSIT